jgi:hypothetical protein
MSHESGVMSHESGIRSHESGIRNKDKLLNCSFNHLTI